MNINKMKKSAPVRKSISYTKRAFKNLRKTKYTKEDYYMYPPVFINSVPKSGTHLLSQIIEALPNLKNHGEFIASLPSLTYKEKKTSEILKNISNIIPGELILGHVFYDDEVKEALDKKNVVQYFIYRDPRDVAISEAHYLTYMNKYHKLHKFYKEIENADERIMFSITGEKLNSHISYKDIGNRYMKFIGWLEKQNIYCIKYEDLMSEKRDEIIKDIVGFYLKHTQLELQKSQIIKDAITNIDPNKSHTFRKGKSGGWKDTLNNKHIETFKKFADHLLIRLGYEKDGNW